jgi:hypothetical protein
VSEAEESPMLEATAGEQLVKKQQAGIVEISGGAVITCT